MKRTENAAESYKLRQRDAEARYAKTAGYELVDEYRDEGVSGAKILESRPGLAALLDRAWAIASVLKDSPAKSYTAFLDLSTLRQL